jgi:hypothetical protein
VVPPADISNGISDSDYHLYVTAESVDNSILA